MNDFPQRRCWAEIDLAALERNLGRIRAALPSHIRYVAVVKADAYGHGIQPMATRLMQSGADLFAVANVDEACALRELGTGWPILLLSPALPHEAEKILEEDLVITLSSPREIEAWETLGARQNRTISVHLKVDTGMGRAGVWFEEAAPLFQKLRASRILKLAGVYTHFACADSDPEFTRTQRIRLTALLKEMNVPDADTLLIHADNSASLETFQKDSPFNAIRVGLLQFGILPYPESILSKVRVEPVLSFHARVGLVKSVPRGTGISYGHLHRTKKKTRLAILTAGYGDGIPVSVSNRGRVLIRGQFCPILGRVCMDQTIVDVTGLPGVSEGDQATLIGAQRHNDISLASFAQSAKTIPYEILTSVTKRVARLYKTSRVL